MTTTKLWRSEVVLTPEKKSHFVEVKVCYVMAATADEAKEKLMASEQYVFWAATSGVQSIFVDPSPEEEDVVYTGSTRRSRRDQYWYDAKRGQS